MINEFDIINYMMFFCTKDLMLWKKNIEGYILPDTCKLLCIGISENIEFWFKNSKFKSLGITVGSCALKGIM